MVLLETDLNKNGINTKMINIQFARYKSHKTFILQNSYFFLTVIKIFFYL